LPIITSFSRYELKYFLTQEQYAALRPRLEPYLEEDQYGQHTIGNIFFDTEDFSVTRTSIEKPVYKEKLRVRAYGTPDPENGQVFVELKKKYQGVVYKRRVQLTIPEAKAFLLEGKMPESSDPQITREIARFMKLRHPVPKVYLCYDRVALFGREDPDLRITFDRNLRWRTDHLQLSAGAYGSPILPDDRILMEIKVPGTMPLWLAHTLSELKIYRTSFSKIGRCYTQFILPEKFSKKAVNTYV
jgi:hypothetical protein